jgi:hypothetical protein
MSTQTITWIALPNGVANGKLKLSVFVSPQFVPDPATAPTLGSPAPGFPDFLNWPARVANIHFDVHFGNGQTFTGIPRSSVAPRADLWTALFNASTPVAPYEFPDNSNRLIRSFPAGYVRDGLRDAHVGVALQSPAAPPSLEDLGFGGSGPGGPGTGAGFTGIFGADGQSADFLHSELERGGQGPGGVVYPHALGIRDIATLGDQYAYAQADLFHDRAPRDGRQALSPPGPTPPAPTLDMHSALTALGDYPGLMRMLGLVFDLLVPMPSVSGDTTVSVAPTAGSYHPAAGPTYVPVSPKTECTVSATRFATGPVDAGAVGPGYLGLKDGYDVLEFDVDGALMKAIRYNDTLSRMGSTDVDNTTNVNGGHTLFPPSLRGAGLAVAEVDRAGTLSLNLARQAQLAAGAAPLVLTKSDLTKGYVVDVWNDHDKAWHTLCARVGTYHFLNSNQTIKITDESSTRMAGTSRTDDLSDDFYLHEIIFRWDGWSLAAPRPGKAVVPDGSGGQTTGSATSSSAKSADFRLDVSFVPVAGSLPRLRYGTTYRFRARTVDLAGNAAPLAAGATDFAGTGATDPIKYLRFEPVVAPFVLPRKPKTAGESAQRVVIRSNYNTAATSDSERHIAPAKVAELLAEEHGLWDASTGKPKASDYGLIAKYANGSYDVLGTADPAGDGTRYYDVNNPGVPYIPDPLARGAVLQDLPGQPTGSIFTVPFARPTSLGAAPTSPFGNGYTFRLAVVEGSGAPSFAASNRVLTVQLPKAAVRVVKLSSYVNAADLPLLGFWSWLQNDPRTTNLAELQHLLVTGRLNAVTPFRELVLVHAVRQPLAAPTFTGLAAARDPAKTFVTLTDTINFDRPSTQKLDIVGSWSEYVDVPNTAADADPADNPPTTGPSDAQPSSARVVELHAAADDPAGNAIALDARHEFGDTKHRWVNYSAIATTRFQDYFVQTATVTLSTGSTPDTGWTAVSGAGIVDQSDVVRSADGTTTYTRDTDYEVDYAGGRIKALKAALNGASVHVAYVAPPVTRSSTERPLPAAVDIKSAARPSTPKVAYVVPTFGWSSTAGRTGQTSTRTGNGLRVYLHRPWWSSGQDEQLGVLVPPDGASADTPDSLRPYVTAWGADPIWSTGATSSVVTVAGFPLATAPAKGVKLAETGAAVNVAPHDVGYDPQRGLWFADIVVNAGTSYAPFVRLALARYQAHSLPDLELSGVVLAEFTKLSPDRTASVVYAGNPTLVTVSVTGLSYDGSAAAPNDTSIVTVLVETKLPGVQGELSWVESGLSEVVLSRPSGTSTWSGDVTLPKSRGQGPMRLVIREFEVYAVDPKTPLQLDASAGRRLVYVDTIEI